MMPVLLLLWAVPAVIVFGGVGYYLVTIAKLMDAALALSIPTAVQFAGCPVRCRVRLHQKPGPCRLHPDPVALDIQVGPPLRPARQRLLDDISARKLGGIVVYKVARLTRSPADFAKPA